MLLLMFLIAKTVYSQAKRTNEYKGLVDSAISILIEHTYGNLSENTSDESLIIYVVDENSKQINLDNVKSRLTLRTIDIEDRKNRKLLKKGLRIWQVTPALNGNIITVNVVKFLVNYRSKMYYYTNGGGSAVFFQYSCEEEKWMLSKVEHNSI